MLEISNHGRIREIRLARPPVNALNTDFVNLLTQSLKEASAECDAVTLSGQDGTCLPDGMGPVSIHSTNQHTTLILTGRPVRQQKYYGMRLHLNRTGARGPELRGFRSIFRSRDKVFLLV